VLSIGGGAREVGLVSGAQFLPFAVLALAAGVVADRVDRKLILIASDSIRLVCQVVAAVLLVTGVAEVWHLAALAAAYGAADAFFAPAFTGLLPQTVAAANLQPANALRGLSFSVGTIAGPALAGVLVALAGPGGALLFDAATFAVSVACLLPLRPSVLEREAEGEPSFLGGLRGGWREVRTRSWVWSFLAAMSMYHVVVLPAVFVLGPVLAERELNGASSWAVITACFGVGALLGDVLLLRWRPARALRVSALMLVVASLQAAIIGSGLGTAGIAALELLAGICVTGFFTLWAVSLQEHIPSYALSRVSSYDYLVSVGLMPLGTAVTGLVAHEFGLRPTLIGMSVVGVAAALALLAVRPVRTLGRGSAVGLEAATA
jgi:MFS family permease